MNPEIKARWVAALRSGEYKQGEGELRSKTERFCCLGVLCDLKDDSAWERDDAEFPYGYGSVAEYDLPPQEVGAWAGFDWYVTEVTISGKRMTLYDHNDAGRTFAEIADAIEAQL